MPSKTTEPTPSSEAEPSGSSRGLSSDRPDASDGLDSEGEGITDCEGPIHHFPVVRMVESIRPIECQEIASYTRDSIMPDVCTCMYVLLVCNDNLLTCY